MPGGVWPDKKTRNGKIYSMKILIVAAYNKGRFSPFIEDQGRALELTGIEVRYFGIVGGGITGYLSNRKLLIKKLEEFKPDLIHAHYGLSGLLANLQRKVPVVTTYHGSDINLFYVRLLSRISILLSRHNIFVSQKNIQTAGVRKHFSLIPCGVDTCIFKPVEKESARLATGFSPHDKLILFAGSLENSVKNPHLAIQVTNMLDDVKLIELKGYTRQEVALLMNVADVCLMTSFTEGSPQFIKEAMACNCPVVSVDVGDVSENISQVERCFVTSYNQTEIAEAIKKILTANKRSNGRERIFELGLDAETVALKIKKLYETIIFTTQNR